MFYYLETGSADAIIDYFQKNLPKIFVNSIELKEMPVDKLINYFDKPTTIFQAYENPFYSETFLDLKNETNLTDISNWATKLNTQVTYNDCMLYSRHKIAQACQNFIQSFREKVYEPSLIISSATQEIILNRHTLNRFKLMAFEKFLYNGSENLQELVKTSLPVIQNEGFFMSIDSFGNSEVSSVDAYIPKINPLLEEICLKTSEIPNMSGYEQRVFQRFSNEDGTLNPFKVNLSSFEL